ncbi:MAG TPA: Nramp family divalent metal transporter [Candidatus Baltobacteraceae bacterium]|nr:Nramp family divalent metal transporter [Candidatus Baltobacteraceae bacterium]
MASAKETYARLLARLGPGFVTGTSDDDPSAIGTYSQAGAQFGLSQLWLALFTFPLMVAIQDMCGRIGAVTGLGLAGVIRRHYARPILYFIVALQVVTNTINIGADLSAMAQSGQLLWPVHYVVWLAMTTAVTISLIVVIPYRAYAPYLKFLGLTLFTYVAAAFTVKADWRSVLSATFVPTFRFDKTFLLGFTAVLGTTISPYEFFWQSNEEVEELVDERAISHEGERPPKRAVDLTFLRWDTIFGMFFSNAVMYCIILVAGTTLHGHGITSIDTAAKAAQALRPFAGPLTFWLFAIGIISAGLLSIPVMAASSAYAVGGALDWKRSLARPFSAEPNFYLVIIGSSLVGLLTNLLPIQPFKLLFYTAVLNGIIAPPLLFVVLRIANNRQIMGENTNAPAANVLGWGLLVLMMLSLVALVVYS